MKDVIASGPAGRRPVVLIVDDEPANLTTFSRSFRRELVVRTEESAEAALAQLAREPADVVVADYAMPGMNGIEFLQIVAERWPTVVRMIVSGHYNLPELQRAHRTGLARSLIAKPWRKADFLVELERLLVPADAA